MYLFAGKKRQADVGSCLNKMHSDGRIALRLIEFDIERSETHDLLATICGTRSPHGYGRADGFLIVSPPCNTFSRARFQWRLHPGPRPLRSRTWPKGFPWLSGLNQAIVNEANEFVLKCLDACSVAVQHGGWFLLEHPEDLGKVHDEVPGTIWQWDEVHNLFAWCGGFTCAVHQCTFGAPTSKPTRLMTNFVLNDLRCHPGFPQFDSSFRYLGPLPKSCGHVHESKLVGKQHNQWKTGPSAAYPPDMCQFIAEAIFVAVASFGGGGETGDTATEPLNNSMATEPWPSNSWDLLPEAGNSKGEGKDLGTTEGGPPCPNFSMVNQTQKPIVDLTSDEPVREPSVESIRPLTQADEVEAFDMVSCLNSGHPIRVEWDTFERDFIDGFGLCSPTRWPPAARGVRRSVAMKRLAFETFSLLADTVRQCIPDVRSAAFALVTGKFQASPFVGEPLESLRTQWAGLLRDPADALVIDSGQPFLLRGMAQWLTVFEDPDVGWLVDAEDCFATGVPLGVDAPLPRSPQVFPEKVKHRKLDDSDFNPVASNYPSAQLSTAELESKFREEELAGRMYPTRYSVLKEEFGEERIRIASMAAITKPDGSIRPLHDGTHSVQVNNRIVYRDQIQCPGPPEVASVVRESVETREAPFCVSADIKSAHRLVKIRKMDWPYMACKADSNSSTVWVNKVGTFGISSAPYWWSKLFALVGRFVGHVMGAAWFLHLVYVDDLHGAFTGASKFLHLWVWVLAFELVGTPFAYHKFRGGFSSEFVGYQMRYDLNEVGISLRRGEWLSKWIRSAEEKRFVVVTRDFAEFLGRLGFVAQLLVWLKPHLSPLFAWSAATAASTVAKLPEIVILTLKYLVAEFSIESYMVSARRPRVFTGEQFRTDAKCTDDSVVLGGWEVSSGRWFQICLDESKAPYLFRPGKGSQWASTSAELLATLAALVAFGWTDAATSRKSLELCLAAGTDNRSNECLSVKRSTTKFPLMLINMQLSSVLSRARVTVRLKWRPREENTIADDITNSIFDQVDLSKRIAMSYNDLPVQIIHALFEAKSDFDQAWESQRAVARSQALRAAGQKRKRVDKTPW